MRAIDINLVTWPNHPERLKYFKETFRALKKYIVESGVKVKYYCSAETEKEADSLWYGTDLERFCKSNSITLTWRNEPANLGANMNAALRLGDADFVLLVQDDWLAKSPITLINGLIFYEKYQPDIIRYSWPDIDRMRPTFHKTNSAEFSIVDLEGRWPYGDDPHLRHRSFVEKWGEYLEGGEHASASSTMMRKLIEGDALIAATRKNRFMHIGDVTSVLNDRRNRRITRENYLTINANHPIEGLPETG